MERMDVSDEKERGLKKSSRENDASQLQDDEQWIVVLKDDSRVDARDANSALRRIKCILADRPESVQELYEFATQNRKSLSDDVKQLFFAHTDFLEVAMAVLLNGAVLDEQGRIQAVGDPFQPTAENKHILAAVANEGAAIWSDFLGRDSDDPVR